MNCLGVGAVLSMILSEDHDGAIVGFDLAKKVSQASAAEGTGLVRRMWITTRRAMLARGTPLSEFQVLPSHLITSS